MKCYNLNCKEECNNIKKTYCIFRINEQQKKLLDSINRNKSKNHCKECGHKTLRVNYRGREARLCTNCGEILQNGGVVEKCWVDSRRVI